MNYNKLVIALTIIVGFSAIENVMSQQSKRIIAFYNLENLFDTIDTPDVIDTEFSYESPKEWGSERYWTKIDRIAEVISKLGSYENIQGPAIIGMCEMENRGVLEDLVKSPRISHLNYKIIHYDSPDSRGIDVAMLYQPGSFKVTNSRSVPLIIRGDDGNRIYTRDQLQVSGIFEGEPMHFIINHWPSRRGGEDKSHLLRNEAASLARSLVDSINATERNARIIVMGDMNDDPIDESIRLYLKARDEQNRLKSGQLFNSMGVHYKQGIGTLCYRDKWNLFDQIILTEAFLKKNSKGFRYNSSRVFNESFLAQQEGRYKGYPFRTYVGDNYHGGYSDHFPTYILIEKPESAKK